jgi:hypothetical protein
MPLGLGVNEHALSRYGRAYTPSYWMDGMLYSHPVTNGNVGLTALEFARVPLHRVSQIRNLAVFKLGGTKVTTLTFLPTFLSDRLSQVQRIDLYSVKPDQSAALTSTVACFCGWAGGWVCVYGVGCLAEQPLRGPLPQAHPLWPHCYLTRPQNKC